MSASFETQSQELEIRSGCRPPLPSQSPLVRPPILPPSYVDLDRLVFRPGSRSDVLLPVALLRPDQVADPSGPGWDGCPRSGTTRDVRTHLEGRTL